MYIVKISILSDISLKKKTAGTTNCGAFIVLASLRRKPFLPGHRTYVLDRVRINSGTADEVTGAVLSRGISVTRMSISSGIYVDP